MEHSRRRFAIVAALYIIPFETIAVPRYAMLHDNDHRILVQRLPFLANSFSIYRRGVGHAGCLALATAGMIILPHIEKMIVLPHIEKMIVLPHIEKMIVLPHTENEYLLFLPMIGLGIAWASMMCTARAGSQSRDSVLLVVSGP